MSRLVLFSFLISLPLYSGSGCMIYKLFLTVARKNLNGYYVRQGKMSVLVPVRTRSVMDTLDVLGIFVDVLQEDVCFYPD